MHDSAHGCAPSKEVLHIEQRVQWRWQRLDLIRLEVVLVATPAAVLSAWQHLRASGQAVRRRLCAGSRL